MIEIRSETLGEAWFNLVKHTLESGNSLDQEGIECLEVMISFPAVIAADPVIERLGDEEMIGEMRRVFFADAFNKLGHSYARLMRGPGGRNDLSDVIELLRETPWSKRAVVTFCGSGEGKVPCINIVQFMARGSSLQTVYFSRGQDAFKKFYADALCLASMARTVAEGVGLQPDRVSGFISSSHIYHSDLPQIRSFLERAPLVLAQPVAEAQPV